MTTLQQIRENDVDYLTNAMFKDVLMHGERREDRTGTGTISLFNVNHTFDCSNKFPVVTNKKVPLRVVFEELMWFLSGSTDLKWLLDRNVHIWDADAYRFYQELGGELDFDSFIEMASIYGFDLGPIYGKQWTDWNSEGFNQIEWVIEEIKRNPESRRLYISAWHPTAFKKAALPCCHVSFQFYVSNKDTLNLKFSMRSNDLFLGYAFNVSSYGYLLFLVAAMTGLKVGSLTYDAGDAHIYLNHLKQVELQISRKPFPQPQLKVNGVKEKITDYKWEDMEFTEYQHHETIKGKVSVGEVKS
ncbi:thymidylate synthase [Bacillus phage NotTheCreek]|uniref:thymidylate synthase n=1 Tax=Bacillus phage NotTheCreek TaxID=1805952 RepID=UPI0007A76F0C|nr:thymidylate synthase [Bacillus phage NotTheCreek]AMW63282.1 thymidylate synthase [Bacillus phage NotTheCreek]